MNSPESCFLNKLFSKLNTYAIKYAVMRNWETLPDSLGGSDLDLLTDSFENAKTVCRIAELSAVECGGKVTSLYRVDTIVMTLAGRKEDGTWWGLHIDVYPVLSYKGVPYFSVNHVLHNSVIEKNLFYRCCDLGDVVAFLKECLHNGKTKKDYYSKARLVFSKHPELIDGAASGHYTKRSEALLHYLLEQDRGDDEVKRVSRAMRCSLLSKAVFSTDLYRLLFAKCKNVYRRLNRIILPPGYVVAFLGTDGSGKSSIIDEVTPFLSRMMHSKTVYEHMRPNLLPSLARLFGRPRREGPITNPHASEPSGFYGSLARLIYYTFDYVFGYWLKVYPTLIKRPTMYIFDRYYYDYVIDPKRSRMNLPLWIVKAIGSIVPKPDLIICLGTEPEVIYHRKSELSLKEIVRQTNMLKIFCDKENLAVWVDTGCSIRKSVNDVLDAITNRMAIRYRRQNLSWQSFLKTKSQIE